MISAFKSLVSWEQTLSTRLPGCFVAGHDLQATQQRSNPATWKVPNNWDLVASSSTMLYNQAARGTLTAAFGGRGADAWHINSPRGGVYGGVFYEEDFCSG